MASPRYLRGLRNKRKFHKPLKFGGRDSTVVDFATNIDEGLSSVGDNSKKSRATSTRSAKYKNHFTCVSQKAETKGYKPSLQNIETSFMISVVGVLDNLSKGQK